MSFKSNVKNVKLKADRVVVVLDTKTFYLNFSDLKLLDLIETCDNNLGLCSLNTEGDYNIIACPDKTLGLIIVKLYE